MSDRPYQVTQILADLSADDSQAAARLLPLVYEELRSLASHKLATEPPDHTLQATALVHEAYLRLLGSVHQNWDNRGHFFAADSLYSTISTAKDCPSRDDEDTLRTRKLNDGRIYKIVKVFYEPDDLSTRLQSTGLDGEVKTTGEFFWYVDARRT